MFCSFDLAWAEYKWLVLAQIADQLGGMKYFSYLCK